MTTLTALRERVREAEGADRELDAGVAMGLDGFLLEELNPVYLTTGGDQANRDHRAPHYTASLDAAVALVERICPTGYPDIQKCMIDPEKHPDVLQWSATLYVDGRNFEANARTAPLAILAALLASLVEGE